ncbi:LysR family transcriptional regulator [Actinosynnema sp. NPDC020468]|uniref:LysR family transcriptional regulator n=1 Tax=Actinosynnema sp. NPDC020468 TaxID=3154488 RepID=UPI003408054E
MELDVHHLRLVRAIGDTGSLSEAAVVLGITQPAVSGKLQRLEHALGQRLFDRGPAAVTPTPTGELLLARISAVLPLMEGLVREIERRSPAGPERLRVGGMCSPILSRLPAIVDALLPSGPGSALFDSGDRDLVVDLVAQRRLDVGVVKDYPGFEAALPPSVASAVIVARDPTMVMLPEGHRLAHRDVIGLDDLADEEWVLPGPDSSRFYEYFHATCRKVDFTPRVRHLSDSAATAVLAVRGGAVGLSQAACEGHPRVAVRLLADDLLPRRFVLLWRHDGVVAGHARRLVADATSAYWAECLASPVYSRYL